MNKLTFLLLLLVMITSCKTRRKLAPDEFFNKDFSWTIKIPASFINENRDEWKEVQNTGKKAIENTYDVKLKNKVKTIFIFKSGSDNYFESTCEPYNRDKRGDDYYKNMDDNYDILYKTFVTQSPDETIDTAKTLEVIDGLEFKRIKIRSVSRSNQVKNAIIYSRLFDTNELTVSIMYADETKGKLMLDAFRNSKFDK